MSLSISFYGFPSKRNAYLHLSIAVFLFFDALALPSFGTATSDWLDHCSHSPLLARWLSMVWSTSVVFLCTRWLRPLPSFTGVYLVVLGFTIFYWVLPIFTGFYLVLLGFT